MSPPTPMGDAHSSDGLAGPPQRAVECERGALLEAKAPLPPTAAMRLDGCQGLQVMLFLPPHAVMRVHLAGRTNILARCAMDDALWAALTRRDVGLAAGAPCRGPDGQDCGGEWHRCFVLWYHAAAALGLRPGLDGGGGNPALGPWIAVWRRLRRWVGAHLPEVAATLRPPAAWEAVLALQDFVGRGHAVAPAVTGLWQVCDGQNAPVEQGLAGELQLPALHEDGVWWQGLFGGYTAYDYEISTVLLPLQAALTLTRILQQSLPQLRNQHRTKLAFACSFNFTKIFLVDVCDGRVDAWTRRSDPFLEPAVPEVAPATVARGGGGEGTPPAADGLLRWVEEYTSRLEQGLYVVEPLTPMRAPATRGVSLFPTRGEEVSQAVARGVQVTGSCVYMPEHPQGWTYSITFRLLGTAAERGFETCQLQSRHWVIREDGREPEHVRGDGVIGFFPILADGGWLLNRESDPNGQYNVSGEQRKPAPFRYQSCAGRNLSMRGYFGGEITFVPGTISHPVGPPFDVGLPAFRLHIPGYLF